MTAVAWSIVHQPTEARATRAAAAALVAGMTPAFVIASLDHWLAAHPDVHARPYGNRPKS